MTDIPFETLFRKPEGGYPFLFASLFGSGADGDLTLTTNSDVGYLGSYGSKQARNATLAAGQTLTIAQGSSSGALMIACTGKLTIAGTITGDGAAGSNAASGAASGAGGATAGGGLGGASQATNSAGAVGVNATKMGHGAASINSVILGRGGASGGVRDVSANQPGGTACLPQLIATASYVQQRVIHSSSTRGPIRCDPGTVSGANGTASASKIAAAAYVTTADVGPWSQTATGLWLPLSHIPGGQGGFGGGCTADANAAAGGGGGGGGGCIIFEADTIELVSGYSITLRGGNGGNAAMSGGGGGQGGMGGGPGTGGIVILICRQLIGSTASINCNAGTRGNGIGTGHANQVTGLAGGVVIIKV